MAEKKERALVGSTVGQFNLVPRSLDEAMQYAKMIADSEMVPNAYRTKAGNVLIAIQMGFEVGLKPLAALQNIAVINGKPGLYGDAGKALLLAAGVNIEDDDVPVIIKNNRARCRITRPDGRTTEKTYSIDDAKKAGLWGKAGPWTTNPYRQMAWRAFWFAARDICADLLKGLAGAEELRDYAVVEDERPPIAEPRRKSEGPAPVDVTVVTEAAPGEKRDCTCGEWSPDRLVIHRKDGPCYLRPSEPAAPAAAPEPPQAPAEAPQAPQAPAAQPAAPQVPEGCEAVTVGIEKAVFFKEGTGSRGKWRCYHITDAEGVRYSTFSETVFKDADRAVKESRMVVLVFRRGEKGNSIEALTVIE